MVVERTINVGFHSNFGAFKRNKHSLENLFEKSVVMLFLVI